MTGRPILFSAGEVRATLAGRKTMARRVLVKQPLPVPLSSGQQEYCELRGIQCDELPDGRFILTRLPYAIGDRLWVRETWRTESHAYDDLKPTEMGGEETILYDADADWPTNKSVGRRRSAFHMSRWASRITLTVTAVKVERLQDISEADARAEGVLYVPGHGEITSADLHEGFSNYLDCRMGFEMLWNQLHGPDAWAKNPWVVAVAFSAGLRNIDQEDAA